MIPANIDHVSIVQDLNRWGIADQKVEMICGFSRGYISKIKGGDVKQMIYQRAARLYNFWFEEHRRRVVSEPIQTLALST
jgi:hypothetical protein